MSPFERVKEISKKRGLSLQKVATDAGLGINAVYRWKTQNPTSSSISKVAKVLNVSTDYLLGNTDEMMPNKKSPEDYSSDELIREFNRRIQNNEMAVGTSINEDNLDDEAMENIKKYIKEQSMLAVLREEQRRGMK